MLCHTHLYHRSHRLSRLRQPLTRRQRGGEKKKKAAALAIELQEEEASAPIVLPQVPAHQIRLQSFSTFCITNGVQRWPSTLPPATVLADNGLTHRGDDILACSTCDSVIEVAHFVTHDAVANAHLRATGSACSLGARARKRKVINDDD